MTINEYKDKVIELFKSGKATEEQYEEMAESVLYMSELQGLSSIDSEIEEIDSMEES